jgi:large subunit ribosomal protein L18
MKTIRLRRRRENKTDYKNRLNLLKSGKDRIVIRKTNKYVVVQAVNSNEAQDKVIAGVSSKALLNNGWDKKFEGSLKSTPACYLTGLLLAKKLGKGEFIIDMGMARNKAGNRIYAVVRGLIDGGLKIPASEKVFPSEDRLNGEHLKDDLKKVIGKVKEKIQ